MKKYMIRVNGKTYNVEVEEVKSSVPAKAPAEISLPPAQGVQPKPEHPPRQKEEPAARVPSVSDKRIVAPMTGTILKVFVEPGDTVENGDILLVLEAMKMENDVIATVRGEIDSVHVPAGTIVNAGDLLITLV